MKEALQEKCVEEDGEISVVKETQLEGMDKEQEGQMEKDQTDQPWTPVMTRRKGQVMMLIPPHSVLILEVEPLGPKPSSPSTLSLDEPIAENTWSLIAVDALRAIVDVEKGESVTQKPN
ncbi:hypothetical protein RIF29_14944 [Crotalaria pallida]|uniref:Uncharacterized protein n=1 Tax=Crotalaria pallida TaxID=3830 RepID=A0AAN9IE71_CROPI